MGVYWGPINKQKNPKAFNAHIPKIKAPKKVVTIDWMKVHSQRHGGIKHVGEKVITNDFVIRHQFDSSGNILGKNPTINARFGERKSKKKWPF